ncbi:uncharacterized protein LOC135691273 [Rhopilema esculentum]|uniref:uncharacterized protein LOC135691273 n=1 Tax=Rhopilema esculentum TaxID=499914 RepID=UPI0031CE6D17
MAQFCLIGILVFLQISGAAAKNSTTTQVPPQKTTVHTSVNPTASSTFSVSPLPSSTILSSSSELVVPSSSFDPSPVPSASPTINNSSMAESSTVEPSPSSHEISSSEPVPESSSSQAASTKIVSTSSFKPTPSSRVTPEQVVVIKCGEECKALKRRLWAAGVFAVMFGFTTLIFIFLLCRQCRIAKEYNDPALSRLI